MKALIEARHDGGLRTRVGKTARTVVIIDSHRVFADLLQLALDSATDLRCVAVAHDLSAGLQLVTTHRPDLVMMDFEFGGDERGGISATADIIACSPETHVLLLTGRSDGDLLRRAAQAGASALMPKDGSLPDLLKALAATDGGGLYVHPRLLASLIDAREVTAPAKNPLSRREQEVLDMLVVGLGTQQVADKLGISKNTCRGYVKTLLRKLNAHTQLEAVAIARRQGLVALSDTRRTAPRVDR